MRFKNFIVRGMQGFHAIRFSVSRDALSQGKGKILLCRIKRFYYACRRNTQIEFANLFQNKSL